MLVFSQTKTNVEMEHITVPSTLSVTTLLDHLIVLVIQDSWEMACNVPVRMHPLAHFLNEIVYMY